VDLTDAVIRLKEVCMVIVDSVAVLIPHKEIEGSAADAHVGIQARLVGTFLRRINNALLRERKRGHYVFLMPLNQFRTKIGVMFGDNRTLPGGKALEFYTSQQVLLSNKEHRSEKGEDKGYVMYNEHGIVLTKDKTGGRIKEGKFKLIRDESSGFPAGYVDQTKTVLTLARATGLYEGAGTRHTLDKVGTFKSHEEIGQFFFENPKALYDFNTRIINHYRNLWGVV
jgi:recombination protein RecA